MLPARTQVLYRSKQFFYPPATDSREIQTNLRRSFRKLSTPSVWTAFLIRVYIPDTPVVFVYRRKVCGVVRNLVSLRNRELRICRGHPRADLAEYLKVEEVIISVTPSRAITRPRHILNHCCLSRRSLDRSKLRHGA